jgi:threonine/homoserine/homoserine lactone efflux protein
MESLIALVVFEIVSAVTPGPNNLLLWASGAEFGFRRTLRHVLGTALGIGVVTIAVAAGLGALVTAVPGVAVVMKVGGSVFLLYLAWQIARSGALARGSIAKPFGVRQAVAFQAINPKAWIFALSAITTFRPVDLPAMAGGLVVATTMMVVVVPTSSLWAAGGGLVGRLLAGGRWHHVVSLALALMLAATIAYVWV